nr:hypothetical protein [Labrenzia sp. VG12]
MQAETVPAHTAIIAILLGNSQNRPAKIDPASWIYFQPFWIASCSWPRESGSPEGSLSPTNRPPPNIRFRKPPDRGFSWAEASELLLVPFDERVSVCGELEVSA